MKDPLVLLLSLCLVFTSPRPSFADPLDSLQSHAWLSSAVDDISAERMLEDIAVLSGAELLGRQTGSPQDMASAAFFADRFAQLRLHRSPAAPPESLTDPLPRQEWKQTAPVMVRTIPSQPLLRFEPPSSPPTLQPGSEFLPVLDSPPADLRAPIVFVGYGLSDQDYAGVEVHGKIVLFLRGKPDSHKGPAAHGDKERLAKQKGAVGYLTATGPLLTAYEQRRGVTAGPSAFYSTLDPVLQLPGAWIGTDQAEDIVRARGGGNRTLSSLQGELNRTSGALSFDTGVTALMTWSSQISEGTLYNVVSIIRGHGTGMDAIVIGAHRDHFGQQAGLLFAGADDNASGTAVILEVARLLAQAPAAPKRSIVFVSFSGEEQGLLGSRLYISQPIVPLPKTLAMINVDHAGIGNGRLTVGVTGIANSAAMEAGRTAGVADRLDLFGFFPGGDHVPFKEAGVPTITVVSGGVHPHFHQPTDTVDTLNPEILRTVARYVLALAWQLANAP